MSSPSLRNGRKAQTGATAALDKNGKVQSDLSAVPEKERLMVADEKAENKSPGFKHDKYMFVYFILVVHGIGTLMPWNMFITANAYFVDYKLKSPGNTTEANFYQRYWLSYLGFVAQIPNVILNGINVFCQVKGGSTSIRIIWSIIIIVFNFILTVILAMMNSEYWIGGFFWTTMVLVVIINMANGVYQNSVYGTAAILPMKYTNAVVLGSNVSGTLASVIAIISKAGAPDLRIAAIYYFLTAIFVLIVAFDTYFALPLIPFYRYHKNKAKKNDAGAGDGHAWTRPPYLYIFRQAWKQYIGVWFVFFVTLTCFPAIQAGVKKHDPNFPISDFFYTEVTCFLFFNSFAMIGSLTTEWLKRPGPRWVWLPIALRGLFIPFFMFCNMWPKSGQRRLPILIKNDYVYCLGGIVMAFTSGYFSSLTMMYAPRQVKEPEYQGTAGMMAAFFLILGIFSGVIFSLPVTLFIEMVGGAPIMAPTLLNITEALAAGLNGTSDAQGLAATTLTSLL